MERNEKAKGKSRTVVVVVAAVLNPNLSPKLDFAF
jgi:hypothetical protein